MHGFLRRAPRFAASRDGSSAVEFAMVFPLLVALTLGVVVIGHAFFAISSVQWAIEKSTRELMIDADATGPEIEAKVVELLEDLTDLGVAIEFTDSAVGAFPMTRLSTELSYPVVLPFVPKFALTYRVETLVPRTIAR